jgi:UDP-glucose 4-epimerase
MARKVLVTGSCGQLGSSLSSSLKKLEFDVFGVDCIPRNGDAYFQCDLVNDDLTFLRNLDVDIVIHLAGDKLDPSPTEKAIVDSLKTNVQGTIRLLGSIGKVANHIIFASSISVYGDSEIPYREDQPLLPRTFYGASKASAEAYLASYRTSSAICILRIAQVFGPGTPGHIAPVKMVKAAESGKVILTCTERTVRDYVHVEDVVRAIISAIQRKVDGIFNIGSNNPTSLVALAEYITRITGAAMEVAPCVAPEHEIWMSVDKARMSLGYEPSWKIEKWVGSELLKNKGIACKPDK